MYSTKLDYEEPHPKSGYSPSLSKPWPESRSRAINLPSFVLGLRGEPQDNLAAILGTMAVVILAQIPAASLETKLTILTVSVMLTSIPSRLLFLLTGGFKLGRFVRLVSPSSHSWLEQSKLKHWT